jgi:hypothetical protein
MALPAIYGHGFVQPKAEYVVCRACKEHKTKDCSTCSQIPAIRDDDSKWMIHGTFTLRVQTQPIQPKSLMSLVLSKIHDPLDEKTKEQIRIPNSEEQNQFINEFTSTLESLRLHSKDKLKYNIPTNHVSLSDSIYDALLKANSSLKQ